MGFFKEFGNTLASGLGMSVGQGAVNTLFGLMGQNIAIKQQKELAKYQLELQKQAPSAYMEGLKRAGISPQFAGGSVGTTTPSIPTPAQSPIAPPSISEGVSTMSNTELQNSQVLLNDTNYKLANIDLSVRKDIYDKSMSLMDANLNVIRQDYKNRVQDEKNSKKQYEMLDEQLKVYRQCAEPYVKMANENLRLVSNQADKEGYVSVITSLQSLRDGLLTQRYEGILDLNIQNSVFTNQSILADIGLKQAQVKQVMASAQVMQETARGLAFENVGKEVLADINRVTYGLQMCAGYQAAFLKLKQLDSTYVPTFEQNKQMYELEQAFKRLQNSNIKSQTFKNYVNSATDIFNSLVGAFNQTANTGINAFKAVNPIKPK